MYLSKRDAERAIDEIHGSARLSKKLNKYMEDFATGKSDRREFGLFMELLLDAAYDEYLEGTTALDGDSERKRGGDAA